jgi:cysteine desulfurase
MARMAKEHNPEVHVHCDAVQAFGKRALDARAMQLDSMSLSAHKIHGPKGIGALYLRKDRGINPLMSGGSQEHKTRPGTENVPGIAGFGAALSLVQKERVAFEDKAERMRAQFWELMKGQEGVYPLVRPEACVPYIVSVRVEGCSSETLLHFLERDGVWVSSGSACHGSAEPTHVLKALGYDGDPGSFRASLALDSPENSMELLAEALVSVVPTVRMVSASR